jgi:hypothetical protein
MCLRPSSHFANEAARLDWHALYRLRALLPERYQKCPAPDGPRTLPREGSK